MKQRILEFIRHLGISNREFEIKCGMSNGYINSMKGQLGVNKLENVLNAYPQINRIWLLTGEGTMLKVDATAESFPSVKEPQFHYGIKGDNNHNNMNGTDNSVVTALIEQLKEKDAQIDRLLKIIEKMQ